MMDTLKAIVEALAAGGPTAIAIVFATVWFLERRDNRKLQREVLNLAVAQVQANVKLETTMAQLNAVVTQALNKY